MKSELIFRSSKQIGTFLFSNTHSPPLSGMLVPPPKINMTRATPGTSGFFTHAAEGNISLRFREMTYTGNRARKTSGTHGRHERGTKKKSESPTGIEPMTSRTPGGHSIHWATRTRGEQGHLTELKVSTVFWFAQ